MPSQQLFSFMDTPTALNPSGKRKGRKASPAEKTQAKRKPNRQKPNLQSNGERRESQSAPDRDNVLEALRAKVGCITTPRNSDLPVFSTGCRAIDRWLPTEGLLPTTLTEWIAAHESAAAGTLAMIAAAKRLQQIPDRPLVIVDGEGSFYPPAAASLGIPLERMILLRPRGAADAIWAIDQSLRCAAVAAVWAALPTQIDDRDARRLQLAAETGRTPGLLVRGFHARGKPSFSEVQFYVSQTTASRDAQGRSGSAISVTLDRVRGGVTGRQLAVQIDESAVLRPLPHSTPERDETAAEHLAARLADPAIGRRATGRRATGRRATAQRSGSDRRRFA
jgi:hypothetical protein